MVGPMICGGGNPDEKRLPAWRIQTRKGRGKPWTTFGNLGDAASETIWKHNGSLGADPRLQTYLFRGTEVMKRGVAKDGETDRAWTAGLALRPVLLKRRR